MTLQNNNENLHEFMLSPCAPLKSRTPRGGGRPSNLTADGLSGVSHIIYEAQEGRHVSEPGRVVL
ncbi:hypothetical protein HaLaN_22907 [Haematococcus lacustris]|uniref:Uncharacterized protein n=1 Tax=Haematococcus lacustris TaxID=44745 RepID=A0A699ZQ98_HAELA|nr:hypothetical protein HaLaN_22907 [Haematococcus lacustris]